MYASVQIAAPAGPMMANIAAEKAEDGEIREDQDRFYRAVDSDIGIGPEIVLAQTVAGSSAGAQRDNRQ
jgi:hypothetical protein